MATVDGAAIPGTELPTLVSSAIPGPATLASTRPGANAICMGAVFLADLLGLAGAMIVGDFVTVAPTGFGMQSPLADGRAAIYVLTACVALGFLAGKSHYRRRLPFWVALHDVLMASAASLLVACCALMMSEPSRSLLPVATTWLMFPIFVMATRRAARWTMHAAGFWTTRTIVIGDPNSVARTLAALASEPVLGYDVVAVFTPDELDITRDRRWRALLQQRDAALLVLTYGASTAPARRTFESLVRERVPFAVMPQSEGLPILGFELTRFFSHETTLSVYRNNLAKPLARFAKVTFDLVAVSVGLLVMSPLLLVIAALIKVDGGPALYGHVRVGANGTPFRCLKFRSMVVDSDAVLRHVLATEPAAAAEWAQTHKLRNDPRITKIGQFLRVTSLDELPQLFNVLRLEMSLVGPRPIVEAEVSRYGEDIVYYYETRPGLTGLWQVSGRAGTSYAQRVELDTWYVKNWSIWHDVAIIAKTIPAVFKRQGAY